MNIWGKITSLFRSPPSANYGGRSVNRKAASYQGTLSNYTIKYLTARAAERQKHLASDRALDLYVNSSLAHGLLESAIADVVGTGLTPQCSPMLNWLQKDSNWGVDWNKKANDWFEIAALDPRNFCDAQRRMSFYSLQALAFFNWKLEGLAAFQVVKRPDRHSPVNICLLPICPSRIRTPEDMVDKNIFDGIEVDDFGAPKAVWVAKPLPALKHIPRNYLGSQMMDRLEITDGVTGLPKVLLVTDVRNIAEYRQDGMLTHILKDIRDGEDFREAALIKAMLANLFSIFIEDSNPTGGIGTFQGGAGNGNAAINWDNQLQELERGLIMTGRPGQKPTVIPNDAPGPNHTAMLSDIYTGVGISTGRGMENVTRKYESSYSASQMSNENAERINEVERQNVLVTKFCQPIWMWWLAEGVTRGVLPVDDIQHFLKNLYAYTRTNWMRPPAKYIDKQKIANADNLRLANKTTTYAEVWGEKGKDWRAQLRQAAEEQKYKRELAEEYGLGDDWLNNGADNNDNNDDGEDEDDQKN